MDAPILREVYTCIITSMIFHQTVFYMLAAFTAGTVIFVASLYINGGLQLGFDANEFIKQPLNWVAVLTGSFVFIGVFLLATQVYNRSILSLLELIEKQKQEIDHLAHHDMLTGLPNLRLSEDRLKMAIHNTDRSRGKVALLYLDLNNFKEINDTLGHDAGDEILKQIAQRLSANIRQTDTASRIGGDEFLIICPEVDSKEDITNTCQRLIDAVREPVLYASKPVQVGVSIGCAIYPDHADTIDELRSRADSMMYAAKTSEKYNYLISE